MSIYSPCDSELWQHCWPLKNGMPFSRSEHLSRSHDMVKKQCAPLFAKLMGWQS